MNKQDQSVRTEAWSLQLENAIVAIIEEVIRPSLYDRGPAHPETKYNALDLMMDVAMAVAYASDAPGPNNLRQSRVPKFLQDEKFRIVQALSASETRRLIEETKFVHRLKELRHKPLIIWKGNTWCGLDEVLRILKDDGPVNFRRIFQDAIQTIDNNEYGAKPGAVVAKEMRTKIVGCVSASSCYETKYNALNAIVDIGIYLMTDSLGYHNCDRDTKTAFDALTDSLLDVGRMFNGPEVDKVAAELKCEPELSAPGFLESFQRDILRNGKLGSYYVGNHIISYKQERLLDTVYKRKTSEQHNSHGRQGLLFEILYLRYYNHTLKRNRTDFRSKVDELLDLFPDRSVPLDKLHFLKPMDKILYTANADSRWGCGANDSKIAIHKAIDRVTKKIAGYARQTCSFPMKFVALYILTEIALRILEWMHISHPLWHKRIFEDHTTEDAVTDTLMNILRSLSAQDWKTAMENETFRSHLSEIEARRSLLPDVLEGMDAVMRIIRDLMHLVTKEASRELVVTLVKTKGVIDLTDE